jgi:8-oxo-dGTP diphosphatase
MSDNSTKQPVVTVDILIPVHMESLGPRHLDILLIKRAKGLGPVGSPLEGVFQGMWAVPGGKWKPGEDKTLVAGAVRELFEETGLVVDPDDLTQIGTYGDVGRDPRGPFVSVVYALDTLYYYPQLQAGDDAAEARWFDLTALPPLAFDHKRIVTETFGL